jgi:hypothetical protein
MILENWVNILSPHIQHAGRACIYLRQAPAFRFQEDNESVSFHVLFNRQEFVILRSKDDKRNQIAHLESTFGLLDKFNVAGSSPCTIDLQGAAVFNSRNGPVKAKLAYLCTGGCCRLQNDLLMKLCTS